MAYRQPPPHLQQRRPLSYDDVDDESRASNAYPPSRRDLPPHARYDDRPDRSYARDRRDYPRDRDVDYGGARGGPAPTAGPRGGDWDRRRSRSPPRGARARRDDYDDDHKRDRTQYPRSRSPPPPRSSRRSPSPARSRSPPRRRRGSRSPSPRDRSVPPPRGSKDAERYDRDRRERSRSVVTAEDAADVEEEDIAALMGFGGFGTTANKPHGELSGVQVKRERAHRQYMNRKGGFNRPLDKIR
ncbi:hypothetical protein JCM21900_003801 [Sporobolomyces salmonicolor]